MSSPIDSGNSSRPTFGGIATGLDTNSILDALLEIERQPLQRLQSRRDDVEERRDLTRQLNTKLLTLRDAARDIDNRNFTGSDASPSEEFLKYAIESTDDEVVTATASGGATVQDIEIEVSQLAQAARQFSYAFDDDEVVLRAGETFTFQTFDADAVPPREEGDPEFSIEATTDLTIQQLKERINLHADNGGLLRAEAIGVGSGQSRLVLTAGKTGSESNFLISAGAKDLVTDEKGFNQDGVNASYKLFGSVERESQSNTVDDALSGITLELKGLSPFEEGSTKDRSAQTLSVDIDKDAVAERLQAFADAFNDVADFINGQIKVDPETKRSGPLGGDASVRSIQAQLRGGVAGAFRFSANPNNPFASGDSGGGARGVGIELDGDGKLTLNREVLDQALDQNANAMREFLSGRQAVDGSGDPIEILDDEGQGTGRFQFDAGFVTSFRELVEPIVRTGDGLLAVRDQGFEDRLGAFDDSIERFEARLSAREETLLARFTQLELIVAGLESQASFLGSLR